MSNFKLKQEFQKKRPFRVTVFKDGNSMIFNSEKPFTESIVKTFPEFFETKKEEISEDIIVSIDETITPEQIIEETEEKPVVSKSKPKSRTPKK